MGKAPVPVTGIDFTKDDVLNNGPATINKFEDGDKPEPLLDTPVHKKVGILFQEISSPTLFFVDHVYCI